MPLTLPNLYCNPSDIMDYIGTDGSDLRLDDYGQATGQIVQVTADMGVGSFPLPITALSAPILKGTVLQFSGSGMPAVVPVTLTATAPLGSMSLTVSPLLAQIDALATANDSGVNLAMAQRLVKACQYGTAQVKLYCCGRYDDSALVQSWSCNRWATALASKWICKRRAQSCPKGIAEDAKEAIDEMKAVQLGMLSIEDIGTRTSGWPFISNFSMDLRYDYNRVRVEPQLSEGTPTGYPQFVDWNAGLFLEY